MIHHPIDRLSEYIDDELTLAERREIDRHLATCDECRGTLEALRQVVNRAATLADVAPSSNLWPGIASRLEPRRRSLFRRVISNTGAGWQVTMSLPRLAAAAAFLIAVSSVGMWMLQLRRAPLELVQVAEPTPPAPRIALAAANFADEQYDSAVADLQRVLKEGRNQLDPATVDVLEHNLAIIDRAIRDARAALAQDPADLYLNGHFIAARQHKLELLRQASALIAEGT